MTTSTNLGKPIGRSGTRALPRTHSAYLLHLLRKSYGMTMRQLAEALGVSLGSVCRWESAVRVPAHAARRLVAIVLECPMLADWDTTVVEGRPALERAVEEWVDAFRAEQATRRPKARRGAGA